MDKHFRKVISYLLLITFIIIQPINVIAEENLKPNAELSNTDLTPIMGKSQATKEQMVEYLSINNPNKTKEYIDGFVTWTIEESNIENVRADVAFALMMKETGFLKFGGSVSETQNNFGGLGAIDGETAGASFESVQMGIRAVVQHLKAYASQDPLNQDCIDPRYNLVSPKGKAPNVEDLGGKWAVPGYDVNKYTDFETAFSNNDTYGQHIVNMINRIKDIPTNTLLPPETPAKIKEVKGSNIGYKDVNYTMITNATSVSGVEYKYWLNDKSTNEWKLLKDYSEINSHTWKPEKLGNYRLVVHVRDKNSTKKYDDYGYKDIEVKVLKPAKIIKVKGNNVGYQGADYIMTTTASSVSGAEYKYWLQNKKTNEWKLLRDYSEINSYIWKPDKLGNYRLVVHVRDKNSTKKYDDYGYKDIEVKVLPPAKIREIKGNSTGYKDVNYTMITNATSVSGVEYKYWLNDKSTNEWKLLKDYSEINSYTWKPEKVGNYRLVVHVRSKSSTKKYDDYGYKDIEVKVLPPAKLREIKGNNVGYKGVDYTMTTNATSVSSVEYKYWLNDKQTNEWKLLRDYSEINSHTWKPEKVGKYRLVVHVKDKNSIKKYDDYDYLDIDVRDNIVYNKKVMLDPGHGGKDPGAQGNGLNEKDIALSIALKTGEILKNHNIDVKYSRTTDVFVELDDRASMANNANSDVFVSFHCNSFTDSSAKGTETYHYPGSAEGAKLAKSIQDSIIKNGVYNGDRGGVKEESFKVLRLTKMPAALVEMAFISNSQDANILKNRQNEMANAIAMGILDYLEIPYNETSEGLYRVQTGAFSQRENAQNLVDELKAKGYEAIIVEEGGIYKVQVGAFSQRGNADKLAEQLKADGFEAIVVR